MDAVFHLQTLILNLQKEIVFAENIAIEHRRIPRGFVLLFHQPFGNLALEAAR